MEKNRRTKIVTSNHSQVCRKCNSFGNETRISDMLSRFYNLQNSGLGELLRCDTLVYEKVYIGEDMLDEYGPHTLAFIHCTRCRDIIGYKYIVGPSEVLKRGDILLIPEKLELIPPIDLVDQGQVSEAGEQEFDLSLLFEGVLHSQEDSGQEVDSTEGDLISSQEDVGKEQAGWTEGDLHSWIRSQADLGEEQAGYLPSWIRSQEDLGQEQPGCCAGITGTGCCCLQ